MFTTVQFTTYMFEYFNQLHDTRFSGNKTVMTRTDPLVNVIFYVVNEIGL